MTKLSPVICIYSVDLLYVSSVIVQTICGLNKILTKGEKWRAERWRVGEEHQAIWNRWAVIY